MSVNSVNGKTGDVNLTGSDIDGVVRKIGTKTGDVTLTVADVDGAAPAISPSFSGEPVAPTPPLGDSSSRLATTQFVQDSIGGVGGGSGGAVSSVNGKTGAVVIGVADISGVAPLSSPTFSGTPTAPTALPSDASNRLATTQFVHDFSQSMATLDSPNFTGQPRVPTAQLGTNTEQIANTAFVQAAVASMQNGGSAPIILHPTEDTSKIVISYNQTAGDGYGVGHIELAVAAVSANGANVGGVAKEYIVKVKFDVATSIISMIRDDAPVGGVYTISHFANRTEVTFKAAVQGGTHMWAIKVAGVASVQLTPSTPTSGTTPAPTPSPTDPRPTVPDQTLYAPYSLDEEFNTGTAPNINFWNNKAWDGVSSSIINYNVSNGNLNLWPQKDANGNWVDRHLDTDGKFYMQYGFLEVEAKAPKGIGVRANIALMSHEGPTQYIALAEFYPGGGVNSGWSNALYESDNYVGGFDDAEVPYSDANWRTLINYVSGQNLSTTFHKYGVHWDSSGITLYFDGQPVGPKISTTYLTTRCYVALELLYGSASGTPDNTLVEGQSNSFQINYVRAWPLASVANPAPTPAPTSTKVAYFGSGDIYGLDGANPTVKVANPAPLVFDTSLPAVPDYVVVNEGVPDSSVSELLAGTDGVHYQWSNYVVNTDADVVILSYCIGDAYTGTTVAQYTNDLRQLIDLAVAQNIKVILETPNETDDSNVDPFRNAMLQVASERGVSVIDQYTYTQTYRTNNGLTIYQMCPNGYLPNQSTYTLKGQYAAQRFSQIMSGATGGPSPTPSPGSNGYIAPVGHSPTTYPVMCFNEEFDGTSLNASLWNAQLWYEATNTRSNYNVKNGLLQMWPQQPFTKLNRTVDTDGKFEQMYGYFEAEMKLPYGWGQWPAFWLYGHRDNAGNEFGGRPEIDFMEAYTGGGWDGAWSTNDGLWKPINAAGSVHDPYGGNIGNYSIASRWAAQGINQTDWPILSDTFHVYGGHWDADGVQFYFDGQPYGSKIPTSGVLDFYMYLLVDLWLGDASQSLAGIPDSSTPQSESRAMQTKYVRAWKLGPNHNGTTSIRGSYNMPQITYNGTVGPAPSPTPSPTPAPTTLPNHIVEYHGTSFVWGYSGADGSQVAHPIHYYLQQKYPNLTVRNEGVNSSSSTKLLAGTDGVHPAWSTYVASNDANVYVIEFGNNDSVDLTQQQWIDNLTALYNYAHGAGKEVIFVSVHINTINDVSTFANIMKNTAQSLGAGYVDNYNFTVANFTGNLIDWMPDGYHLLQAGYTLVGQNIADLYAGLYASLTGTPVPAPTPTPSSTPDPLPMGVPTSQVGVMSFREEFDKGYLDNTYWYASMPYESETQDSNLPYRNADFSSVNYKVSTYTDTNNVQRSTLKVWPDTNASGNFYRKTFCTEGRFFQRYGIFEAKMKLPRGRGVWPAFWLFTTEKNNPIERDEVDILEAYPGAGNPWGTSDLRPVNYGTTLWDPAVDVNGNQNMRVNYNYVDYFPPVDFSAAFHVWTVVWDSTGFTFYIDGQQIGAKVSSGGLFTDRLYILLDLWYGSISGAPNVTETPRGEGNSFEIEYVYAWKLANGTSLITGTAPIYTPNTGTSPAPAPSPTPSNNLYPTGQSASTYVLTFADEFGSTGSPDTAYWYDTMSYEVDNATINYDVAYGALRIWPTTDGTGQFFRRTLSTRDGKFEQAHGFFEWDVQAPVGDGLRVRLGLFDANNVREISIDMYTGAPSGEWSTAAKEAIDFNIQLYDGPTDNVLASYRASSFAAVPNLSTGSHKFGIRWSATDIKFYLDGSQVGPTISNPGWDAPMYVFQGIWPDTMETSPGAGTPTGSSNSYKINYVRAWSL